MSTYEARLALLEKENAELRAERDALRAKADSWDKFVSLQSGNIQNICKDAEAYNALRARIGSGRRVAVHGSLILQNTTTKNATLILDE